MNFRIQEHNGVVELATGGNILQESVEVLKERLYELIEDGKVRIVLNMAQSNYVSSLCLAVIVDVKNRLAQSKGDLKIANVNRLIRNLLEITNLVKKVELFDSVEEAVASFMTRR
ncbi:MAG: STAS domain-containing protein [Chitinispirillaceae bacterium]|nr:STAS domain-containing protein [Chitinispirillaceae bacterium]